MRQVILVFALFVVTGALPFGTAQTPSQLQVTPTYYDHKVPLTEALRVIGLDLKGGFVSFGVDISGETEPEVDINMSDTTLVDALQRITSQIPGYTSEFVSEHVVEIYPAKDRADPDDPLNLSIREFSVKDVPATTIFTLPSQYIPELGTYLSKGHDDRKDGSGPGCGYFVSEMKSDDAPGITLSLAGRTVRQILDAVAEADAVLPALTSSQRLRPYPVGWVHRRRNDAKLGLVHTWSAMSFAPHDWKQYVAK